MFLRLRLQSVYQDPVVFVKDDFACRLREMASLCLQSQSWPGRDRAAKRRNSGRSGLQRAEQHAAETQSNSGRICLWYSIEPEESRGFFRLWVSRFLICDPRQSQSCFAASLVTTFLGCWPVWPLMPLNGRITDPTALFSPIPAKAAAFGKERVLFQLMSLYKTSYVTTGGTKGVFFSHETQDRHIFDQSFR